MKISVIVPTYKPQGYLCECLDSIYNQTFPKSDYELVLVLNGCNEPYNTQILDWLSNHPDLHVQYFQTDEGGVSNARNIALDNVKGEYVTFIDDDDFISPVFLEELYKEASSTNNIVSLCYPYAFKDGNIDKQIHYTVTDAYYYCIENKCNNLSTIARKYFSGPCMKLIPMNIIGNRRYDKRFRIGEDSLFMFLISNKIKNIVLTSPKAIYYRRYRDTSASFINRSIKEQIINNLRLIWEYIKIFMHGGYNPSLFATRVASRVRELLLFPIIRIKKNRV